MSKTTDQDLVSRVAGRYASAQLDEKMKTLLLKLRKGADASLSQGGLWKVLALLGGWRVEPIIGLVPSHYTYQSGHDEPKEHRDSVFDENEDFARRKYEEIQAKVVKTLPSHPEEGREYVMDLKPFKSWELQYSKTGKGHGADYKSWTGAQGWRITSPDGKTFELLPNRGELKGPRGRDRKKILIYDAMAWLKKETSYIAQINEVLGMEEHVPSAKRSRDNTGTCGACFRNIKLVRKSEDNTVMALHGYNRPGFGYVVGKCWGGDHEPYELGCSATKMMLDEGNQRVADAYKYLKSLSSPTLEQFDDHYWWSSPSPDIQKKEVIVARHGISFWEHILQRHIKETQYKIKGIEAERDVYKWLVENWKVRDLPKEGTPLKDWFEEAAHHVNRKLLEEMQKEKA
jgi:hypothetical protein